MTELFKAFPLIYLATVNQSPIIKYISHLSMVTHKEADSSDFKNGLDLQEGQCMHSRENEAHCWKRIGVGQTEKPNAASVISRHLMLKRAYGLKRPGLRSKQNHKHTE